MAAVSPGVVTTDTTGAANFNVQYPENYALWVTVRLTATATVTGTAASTSTSFLLPMLASYLSNTTASPPGYPSPFGLATVCTNPH